MNTSARLIRKYPNRRLYDTTDSCYITLDQIRQLVLDHENFEVIDTRSGENVTHHVLLQIINEQEAGHHPFFTREILQGMIRFYGNPLQKIIGQFIEKSFATFPRSTNNLQNWLDSLKETVEAENPLHKIAEITKENLAAWQSIFKTHNKPSPRDPDSTTAPKTPSNKKSRPKTKKSNK